ncbi:hypothetical protein VOLCADRAFT_92891 [Volvox carteri f. nagariensis]|uniref:Protein kinase domain-containing protein n=1 Tax=Volvox carteri f. nagariensis TaxID=3068 RepID=D8U0R0_VOLCA|nr:uncharacterized protein VOLCADRAFT_92891 [Volvox carteri f. nagariensis]EFJ46759.1 hypothetical protein VOLCADRAFT_92891 [Volvox carteri f. nagariensis]|eukprot:XP_002952288.1 hypothetical protein VOLCADRAFT_92891 [Volvox carteri f. nagariensis]
MGCFNSKEALYDPKGTVGLAGGKPQHAPGNQVSGSASGQHPPAYLLEAAPQSILLGSTGQLTPSGNSAGGKYAIPNSSRNSVSAGAPGGSFIALGAAGGSTSGVSRRTPAGKGAHVSADLNAIVDDQGTINALVSRQLSVMSHYSVKSEAGSVILQPELAHGPNALGFTLHKLIGRGGFGNVYLGEWEGRKVAVKVVTGSNNETQADQPEDKEWEARKEKMAQMEAILMASVNHPNIVHTLKVIAHQGDAMDPELAAIERELFTERDEQHTPAFEWHIIMEYCDRGSFSRALASMRFHEFVETAGYVRWDAWACLQTLKEVTKALIFLHENRILHGDLKAANVLLSSSDNDRRGFVAKVSDFGLSRVLAGNRKEIKTQTFGTVTHMPPELLSKGILSPSADVYAMGVLLWEAYSGDRVFKQLSDSEVILAVVTRKARPQFPPDTPHRFKYLAERCWAELAEVRPSLQQLYNELENLQAQLCPQGQDSPRLLVQSCIKQKRSVGAVPPVQMAGAKGPGQQSRLAQGVSTDGTAKGGSTALPKAVYTSTPARRVHIPWWKKGTDFIRQQALCVRRMRRLQSLQKLEDGLATVRVMLRLLPKRGREYNSGGGHLYVNSPLGAGPGGVASHGPSQADKLKTFAALNRTQQSAKKSSEHGNGPPSGNGYGSPVQGTGAGPPGPGSGPRPVGPAAGLGASVARPLMKVPSLHKARETVPRRACKAIVGWGQDRAAELGTRAAVWGQATAVSAPLGKAILQSNSKRFCRAHTRLPLRDSARVAFNSQTHPRVNPSLTPKPSLGMLIHTGMLRTELFRPILPLLQSELSVSHSAASSPTLISPYFKAATSGPLSPLKNGSFAQHPVVAVQSQPIAQPTGGFPPAPSNRAALANTAGLYSPIAVGGGGGNGGMSSGPLPPLNIATTNCSPMLINTPASPGSSGAIDRQTDILSVLCAIPPLLMALFSSSSSPLCLGMIGGSPDSPPVVPNEFLGRARTASATGISRPSRFGHHEEAVARQASTGSVPATSKLEVLA